jgi:hypothetical protein
MELAFFSERQETKLNTRQVNRREGFNNPKFDR